MAHRFEAEEDVLRVLDEAGRVVAETKLSAPIDRLWHLEGTNRVLALLSLGAKVRPSNLLCLDGEGRIAWHAEVPQSHDGYVHVLARAGAIIATSWSGFRVRLDPETGSILEHEFVK